MGPTDNTPDFDQMTPEEIMAWMESLAKRQGASEGFTTAADVEVPEIDPDSVVIDEPGYIPYGQEESVAKKPAAVSPPPVAAPPPIPISIPQPEPEPVQFSLPMTEPEPSLENTMGENALAWLESLAADQNSSDFMLDLSSLEPEPQTVRTEIDPVAWLKSMEAEPELHQETAAAVPESSTASTDAMDWLDTLARRPETPLEETPSVFGVEPAPLSAEKEPLQLENPAAWLDSLAVAGGFEDESVRAVLEERSVPAVDVSIEAIELAIREGRVTPEQIKYYQEYQMERASHVPDMEGEELDLEAPAEPISLPDWLAEMKAEADKTDEMAAVDRPPLESLFDAPVPVAAEVPDWLHDEDSDTEGIQAIFAEPAASEIEVDYDDPWVEAFDEEYARGRADLAEVPDWYLRNISDPERQAIVEGVPAPRDAVEPEVQPEPALAAPTQAVIISAVAEAASLVDAALPTETNLPAGERQAVPSWMTVTSTQAAAVVSAPQELTPAAPSMPDWLRETDEQPAAAVTDWLTPEAEEPATVIIPAAPPPVDASPPAPPPPTPATAGTLEEARTRFRTGDLDGSIVIYDALVRASQALADVADDLHQMARSQPKNPVIHRVLGDSLMRQGRLQEALNTYREALNWL